MTWNKAELDKLKNRMQQHRIRMFIMMQLMHKLNLCSIKELTEVHEALHTKYAP